MFSFGSRRRNTWKVGILLVSLSLGSLLSQTTRKIDNMSWQAYTDNLIASQKLDRAALYSRAGDSQWAQSNNCVLAAPEIAELAAGFDNPSNLQASGLHVQGQKYFLLRADERSIYGKQAEEGIIAVRTKQAILVAHYPAGVQAAEATVVVEKLADYLISVGY